MLIIQSNDEASEYLGRKPNASTLIYYSFDDSNLNDGSGKGNNGSWYNGTGTFVNGLKGKGVNIAGTRGISIPIQMINGDFTYSICVYINNLSSPTIQSFLGTIQWGTSGYFHYHYTNGNGKIAISFSYGSPDSYTTPSAVLSTGTWKNIILTRSGDNWNLYVNGTNVLSFTRSYTVSGGTWTVGCEYTDGRAINGIIDEVILENKARTSEEITKYVNKLGLT